MPELARGEETTMQMLTSPPATSRVASFAIFALPLALTGALWLGGGAVSAVRDAWLRRAEACRAEAPSASARPMKRTGGTRFDPIIYEYASRYAVDPALVKAVMRTESGFRPHVESPAGARGLMQVMPDTARAYGVHDLYDPKQNVRAGVRHLRYLLDRHDNDPVLAVAAYNAGSSVVERYGGVPPYRETRTYVARVMRQLRHYRTKMKVAGVATKRPELG